jgi:AcrR family transcriptional regulator
MTPNGPAITPPAHHTPSRKDARTNRERILTAARSAFAASSSASLSAIARQADGGLGTLYRHFPSPEALIVELERQGFGAIEQLELNILVNLSSPQPLSYTSFMRALRSA